MAYEKWWVGVGFGYAPDDPAVVYTDLTSRVETITSPFNIVAGDTAETTGDGGSLAITFQNNDQALTPGNQVSPYWPNVKSAVRIWIRETIGTQTFDLFQGFIEWPQIDAWTASTPSAPRSQTITVTAVDRLGRLRTSRRFISTLAAHIRGEGQTRGLLAYWPLNESGAPLDSVPSGTPLEPLYSQYAFGVVTPTDPPVPSITFATADPPPGDDVRFVEFQPARDISGISGYALLLTSSYSLRGDGGFFSLGPTDVMTMIAWAKIDSEPLDTDPHNPAIMSVHTMHYAPTFYAAITLPHSTRDIHGYAQSTGSIDWFTDALAVPIRPGDVWIPIGLQFGLDANRCELWAGRQRATGTLTITTPGVNTAEYVEIGQQFDGAVAHAQVYVGPDGSYTYEDFLAQYEVGLLGLDQQLTGERIRTVLGYAGVPAGELGRIDDGVSVMQPARLAGQSPSDAIGQAVTTEQGAIYVTGGGIVDFADRRRRYNI